MKKISLIIVLLIFIYSLVSADHKLTRGPEVGEIYFIGPTVTEPAAIYHSTNFGETATCMDSTLNTNFNFFSITADLTPGILYGQTMSEALYISYDYGQEGSWQFRDTAHWDIHSGRNEGEVYDSLVKHSIDYGINFISHSMNGFFGSRLTTEIDNQDEFGYVVVNQYGIPDTLWLLITYNNFETLEIQNVYNVDEYPLTNIRRGTQFGELYNFAGTPQTILYSIDYGLSWQYINEFNIGLSIYGFVGGRQEGEVYALGLYNALMHTIEHTYIFHSTDYGRTFTVYHSFSKGEEPLVANFSSTNTEGVAPFSVQFSNYSVGEVISYEWDFDNDGTIDSNELEPEFTYQDTGYYSVKLIIHDQDGTDEFLREDFIHITDGSGIEDENIQYSIENFQLSNYHNPFNPHTTINYELPDGKVRSEIFIYNIRGQLIETLPIYNTKTSVNWKPEDCSSGIYFYKLNLKRSPIKKMLLLK
ncbi:MAG: T9SS type A sorting domain-containing protein [Candidatus Cloacimonetes bacterium]|nr:T9SS type A sorting domain-containing protein [Candidatus Cloacimonadota bacterium]